MVNAATRPLKASDEADIHQAPLSWKSCRVTQYPASAPAALVTLITLVTSRLPCHAAPTKVALLLCHCDVTSDSFVSEAYLY